MLGWRIAIDRKDVDLTDRRMGKPFETLISRCQTSHSKKGAGAKVGDVYVMRSGYRPHSIVCLDRATDTMFEDFVDVDAFGEQGTLDWAS